CCPPRPGVLEDGGVMSSLRSGSGRWQWRRVRRVEGLHPSLVVAVERRHRAVRSKAEVVASRVGEPGTDLMQIDSHTAYVDKPRRGRRQVQRYDLGLAGRFLAAAVLSWASVLSRLGCYSVGSRYPSRDADRDSNSDEELVLGHLASPFNVG